jgi:hypothetical protein
LGQRSFRKNIQSCETDDLGVLYEIVFGAKEVSSWWRRWILQFDGFNFAEGSSDYNFLEERIEICKLVAEGGNKWDS